MKNKKILLAHGGGGSFTRELIEELVLKNFSEKILHQLEDSAIFSHRGSTFAFTTDSYVVQPIFFPGGDIGRLAVSGTVNDLAMMGAQPLYLTLALIIEEGLDYKILERIVQSIKRTVRESGIKLVGGDLKVVEHGSADKIFINSSGIGLIKDKVKISARRAQVGDKIILSGAIAEHGLTILSERQKLSFTKQLKSDCAPLYSLVKEMLKEKDRIHPAPQEARGGKPPHQCIGVGVKPWSGVHTLRDPTRGGVAAVLNEIAIQSRVGIRLEEGKIPIKASVRAIADLLGLDPLNIPNEGKLVALVSASAASKILARMHRHSLGKKAAIIGEVVKAHPGLVVLETKIGGERLVDMPQGEDLPRIC